MDKKRQKDLLNLSRKVLENELLDRRNDLEIYDIDPFQHPNGLFVTLKKKGKLRGCIGRIESELSLFQNVIDLSKAAAFEDQRFNKVTRKELDQIVIEISILTIPEEVEGISSYDKIRKIRPKTDGVVLSAGGRHATYLPQVWDSIPIREDFISDLCQKAGLQKDYWKNNMINISTYQVEHFDEDTSI